MRKNKKSLGCSGVIQWYRTSCERKTQERRWKKENVYQVYFLSSYVIQVIKMYSWLLVEL